MITVHHLNNSRSQRILWLLEELGLDYEIKRYERDPKTMLAPPELTRIHPLGKSPVIEDDGLVIAETGAIIDYLLEAHGGGGLRPAPGTAEARRFTYWMHYAEGSLMPILLMKLVFDRMESAPAPFFVRPIIKAVAGRVKGMIVTPQLARHTTYLEAELNTHPWFAGDCFTAADIMMSFPLEGAAARGGLMGSKPKIKGFLERIHARPAYKRALERGGPYTILNAE